MNEPIVIAVDERPGARRLYKHELDEAGMRAVAVATLEEAIEEIASLHPDLLVIEDRGGVQAAVNSIQQIRSALNGVSVLVVAEGRTPGALVTLLDGGADAVIGGPVAPGELAATVRAVLRRAVKSPSGASVVKVDGVEVDFAGKVVRKNGTPVNLTRTEYLVVEYMARHAGQVVLMRDLLLQFWGEEYADKYKYLRVWISRLRAKLEDDPKNPKVIKTHHGMGYLLGEEKKE